MISYYLERGFDIDSMLNLSEADKNFLKASCMYQLEQKRKENEMLLKILGG